MNLDFFLYFNYIIISYLKIQNIQQRYLIPYISQVGDYIGNIKIQSISNELLQYNHSIYHNLYLLKKYRE